MLLVLAAGGAGVTVWQAGVAQRFAASIADAILAQTVAIGFQVHEVFVIGRHHTALPQLREALGVGRGSPILALDLAAARMRIEGLPWVRHATVERILPDTVVVRVVERQPIALWQRQGVFSVIDETGAVITLDDFQPYGALPVVVGDDAPAHALTLLQLLAAEPDLVPLVTAAVRIGRRRWNLHLKHGIIVQLPEQDALGAWHRLAAYHRHHRILEKGLQTVDLRFGDRLIVRRAAAADPVNKKSDA